MFSLILECTEEDSEYLIARLWEAGTAGIVERADGIEAFFDDGAPATPLMIEFAPWQAELVRHEAIDWARRTEEAWPPVLVGERFLLAPPWCADPTPSGRFRLKVNPGMACGTGQHPCTQLCLEAMERYLKPGDSLLDVGAGSGILSQAAKLLGAVRVAACDIDADAVSVARAALDAPLFVGSADAVRTSIFDVVVANISAEAMVTLWRELERVRKPGGRLILSGFQELHNRPAPLEVFHRDGWSCLVY